MNDANHNLKPETAIEELLGEQFIEWVLNYVRSEVKRWPVHETIRNSASRPEKIKKFMLQYYLAALAYFASSDGDPGFLGFAIANLSEVDDPTAEAAVEILEQKQLEETTAGLESFRQQWKKILVSLGATEEEISRIEPKEPTRNFIAELSDVYSNSEWQTAMGGLAAYAAASQIQGQVLENLIHQPIPQPPLIEHILDKIAFDPETKKLVFDGAAKQLNIHQQFLNGLAKYLG